PDGPDFRETAGATSLRHFDRLIDHGERHDGGSRGVDCFVRGSTCNTENTTARRSNRRIQASVLRRRCESATRRSRVAADLIEERHADAPCPPVYEPVLCLQPKVERNALSINGVLTSHADDVTQLVDEQVVSVGCESFTVALSHFVFSKAITCQL